MVIAALPVRWVKQGRHVQPKGVPTVKDGFFVVDLWRTILALMLFVAVLVEAGEVFAVGPGRTRLLLMLSIAVLKDEDTNLVTNPRRTRLVLMTSSRVIGVGVNETEA